LLLLLLLLLLLQERLVVFNISLALTTMGIFFCISCDDESFLLQDNDAVQGRTNRALRINHSFYPLFESSESFSQGYAF
jgi:hypothetical protein